MNSALVTASSPSRIRVGDMDGENVPEAADGRPRATPLYKRNPRDLGRDMQRNLGFRVDLENRGERHMTERPQSRWLSRSGGIEPEVRPSQERVQGDPDGGERLAPALLPVEHAEGGLDHEP